MDQLDIAYDSCLPQREQMDRLHERLKEIENVQSLHSSRLRKLDELASEQQRMRAEICGLKRDIDGVLNEVRDSRDNFNDKIATVSGWISQVVTNSARQNALSMITLAAVGLLLVLTLAR